MLELSFGQRWEASDESMHVLFRRGEAVLTAKIIDLCLQVWIIRSCKTGLGGRQAGAGLQTFLLHDTYTPSGLYAARAFRCTSRCTHGDISSGRNFQVTTSP